ncbi:MAG: sensor histidine kinase [Actinomycetota bacterium]
MRSKAWSASRTVLPWWMGGLVPTVTACAGGLAAGLNATAAAGLFVLAVIAGALLAGLGGGLLASVLSFVALNWFFTPPLRTFRVGKADDLVALAVFLAVSVVVSRLFAVLVEERRRAERREQELGRLLEVAETLLRGSSLRETLGVIARSLVDAFALAGVEIRVEGPDTPLTATAGTTGSDHPVDLALGDRMGTVTLHPRPGVVLGDGTLGFAEAFVSQAALAVERTRLDDAARRARLDSEAADMRAALFSAVTHDLKTPLSSVKAAVTSLLDEGVRIGPEDARALLETILVESDRLDRLLGNVVDLARLSGRTPEPRVEPVDLAELVGAVLQRLRPRMDGHEVDVLLRDDLPEVAADPVQTDQVLTNIVENALRFSPAGAPIQIRATRWQSSVEVRVADRGPGIPEAERERVFESFYRKDRGDVRGGSGLGLTIARAIVTAHRGSIRVETTPGGGTTVVFSLPAAGDP